MIFCKVDDELVKIIKKYAKGRHIVDVGCGDGLLGTMMKNITSIDLFPRSTALISSILYMNAIDYPFDYNSFPVFLRPCHGSFVSNVLDKHGTNLIDCLYVSNPRNLENDINTEKYEALQLEDWNGGDDNEKVYLIKLGGEEKMNNTKRTFLRVSNKLLKENDSAWWELRGDRLYNKVGGWHPYDEDYETAYETAYANGFEELDWSKTYLNNPDEVSGWLSPDGIFYGCPSESHSSCAYLVIKKEERELEKEGYIRISNINDWFCDKEITEKQAIFLLSKGYTDEFKKLERFTIGKSWTKARKYFNTEGD